MPLDPGQLDNDFNFVNADCMAKHIDDALAKLSPLPTNLPPEALKAINHSQRNAWIAISKVLTLSFARLITCSHFSVDSVFEHEPIKTS